MNKIKIRYENIWSSKYNKYSHCYIIYERFLFIFWLFVEEFDNKNDAINKFNELK